MYIEKVNNIKYRGIITGVLIISVWLVSLIALLLVDIQSLPGILIPELIFWQTFLYVGLFITAHDAIHGLVAPGRKIFNKIFGVISVTFYALFRYSTLHDKHWEHHKNPATEKDPDYHDGTHKSFFPWYGRFMLHYLSPIQIIGMAIVFNVFLHLFQVPMMNLIVFWIAPALLSTLQLFYFGTYLPHKEPPEGYSDEHRATTNDYPVWLSLLTCYHFGYHWEHHAYPHIPWWMLPKARKRVLADKF